jgi:hypothetical protein
MSNEPLLLQACDVRPRHVVELGQRRSAPGGDRVRQPPACPSRLAAGEQLSAVSQRALEPFDVELVRGHPQSIAGGRPGEPVRISERLAQS